MSSAAPPAEPATPTQLHGARPDSRTGPVGPAPVYAATDLLRGGNLALIELGTQVYQLRLTRAGKLILTK